MHETTIKTHNGQWRAVCTCDQGSPYYPHKWEASEWSEGHLALMRSIHTLGEPTPSLRHQYQWFRTQQADPLNSERDRALWKALADELEHRVRPTQNRDEALF